MPAGLFRITAQHAYFRGPQVTRIDLNILAPIELEPIECVFEKLAHGMGLAGRDYVVTGFRLLQRQPNCLDVVACKFLVASGAEIA